MGPRRVGKTYISKSIPNSIWYDCELPRVRKEVTDAENFFNNVPKNKIIIFDEIHRLENPSEVLKIASDHFPKIKVIATGSSSLSLKKKFKDTLTGRKNDLLMTPIIYNELNDFKTTKLEHRMLFGGLPPFFMEDKFPENEIQEWIDSFWAKDVQELYRVDRKVPFLKLFELIFCQSGGIFDSVSASRICGVSHTAVSSYLEILESFFVASVVRPFTTRKATELVKSPKVYGFDTGFVSYFKGWDKLREDDKGFLWEHIVLNEFMALSGRQVLKYWRTKQGHEVDFVLTPRGGAPVAIECKLKKDNFDISNIKYFRNMYPKGENILLTPDTDRLYVKNISGLSVTIMNLSHLPEFLKNFKV